MKQPPNLTRRGVVLAALAVTCGAARAQKKYDTGATDTSIKLGMAMPLSGPVSSYGIVGRVADAYFKMLNQQGGINGRKVEIIMADDQYSPPKTAEVVRKLVEQDEVLAVFGNLGSAANAAVMKYLNAKKVPQLFIGVGAARFNDPKTAPYTLPFLPSYEAEGRLYGAYILKTKPNAKIAVIYQNDDLGRDLLKGLKASLGSKAGSMVVAEQSYEVADPTIDSQIIQLHASGADVLLHFSTARFAAQGIRKAYDLGWRPEQQYVTYISANVKTAFEPAGLEKAKGVIAMQFLKDPVQPRWASDPATQEYLAFMKKWAPDENVANSSGVLGYVVAQTMAHVLRTAGDNLTRDNIMKIATSLHDWKPGMLMPGLAANTSPTDYFPFSQLQLARFDGKELEPIGAVIAIK